MPRRAPTNSFGLTAVAEYDTSTTASAPLAEQLAAVGVPVTERELPGLAGMGGAARLLCFTSPRTGQPVTVFVVPQQYEVDAYAETYLYFEGMSLEDATSGDVNARWVEVYDWWEGLGAQRWA